jgi:Ca2+-transporting ATPase
MAAATLAVIYWAGNTFDESVAHTMGLVTFSMFHLFFSLETSNEERTIFSSELLENPILLRTSLVSLLTIFLATAFGPLQRILDTVDLTVEQWAVCILVAASIIVVAEVRKFVRSRRAPVAERPVAQPVLGSQPG